MDEKGLAGFRALKAGFALAGLVCVLDQISKWWILDHVMQPPRVIEVAPFFNLVLGWNQGVSFGMFGGGVMPPWGLAVLAAVIVGGLSVWLWKTDRPWGIAGIGFIIGGAIGNVIDRLRFGAVADFLDFHVLGYHWPAFNVADIGITVGAAVLVLDSLFTPPEHPKTGTGDAISDAEGASKE